MVLQLLIDAGIPGYGHRYNILDHLWTHVAAALKNLKACTRGYRSLGLKRTRRQAAETIVHVAIIWEERT
jgi:hypothetical protein